MSLYINDKRVEVKELIEKYGVPVPPKKRKYVDFELHPTQVKPDYLNGGLKHTVSRGYPTVFRSADPKTGEDIQIVYSKTPPRKNKDERIEYSPRELIFNGHKQRFDLSQNLEQYVYTYLYPGNEDSPFHKRGKEKEWRLFNPEKIAKAAVAQDESLTEALMFVKQTDADTLKMLGKGMGMSFSEDMTDVEVRAIMTSTAKTNPQTFLLKVTSNSIQWRGRIKDAIDTNIFVMKTINGLPRWFWAKGDRDGKEICIIDSGANPFEFLVQWMIEHDFQDFYGELNRVQNIEGNVKKLETALDSVQPEVSFKDMVLALVGKEKIDYNRETRTVSWIVGEELEKIVKVRSNSNKSWMETLEEAANTDSVLMDKIKAEYRG